MIFDKFKLKIGDEVFIKNNNFVVLDSYETFEHTSNKNQNFRNYLAIYLHNKKSGNPSPTHLIKYYPDKKEAFLLELRGQLITNKDIKLDFEKL